MKRSGSLIILCLGLLQSCDNNIKLSTMKSRSIASTSTEQVDNLPAGLKNFLIDEQASLRETNSSSHIKFPLSYYLIPDTDAKFLYTSSLNKNVKDQLFLLVSGSKYYKLFIHPESENHYDFLKSAYRYIGPEESEFMASPTSHYRSLVVWNSENSNQKPFIVKVSLDKGIVGSAKPIISENEVERAIANQKIFELIPQQDDDQINLKIFPESAGLIFDRELNGTPDRLGGQIIKEIPSEMSSGDKRWISFSTLIGLHLSSQTPIMEIIKKSGLNSYDFFEQYMIKSYLDMFEKLSLTNKINFEARPQSLFFETTKDLSPTGKWVIRDFTGRGNYISSYTFFYKKQIFDALIEKVAKLDPTLTPEMVTTLKGKIDNTYLKLINNYLKSYLKNSLEMNTYKKIEELVTADLAPNKSIEKKPIQNTFELRAFIEKKKANKEWIELSRGPKGVSYFFLTDHAVYEMADEKILSLALFNQKELKNYKDNKGMLDGFLQEYQYKANSGCFNMMVNFFR